MPAYEYSIIFRALQRPELTSAIKRCCSSILDKGGIIRGMENLGLKQLPYKMTNHGNRFYEGNYILIKFNGATTLPSLLGEEMKRDTTIIKKTCFTDDEYVRPCASGPCEFGELPNPDHEKQIWFRRNVRRHTRAERRKMERKA